MSDLRSQIKSLSPAEKAELLDTVWETWRRTPHPWRKRSARSLITGSPAMSRIPPTSPQFTNLG